MQLMVLLLVFGGLLFADEGMYPLSEIDNLNLPGLGFDIPADELYNPEDVSLIDGICKVGGCSGSFVSDQGLILTNHHCAHESIRDASTPRRDLLEQGFHARNQAEEVPAEGYKVRITVDYQDVSQEVLSAVSDTMAAGERHQAIEDRIKELEIEAETDHPGLRADIAEMFIGRTYVLFLYDYLKDVRLVYAPPRSIGNFGGDIDNWMWPRHTGDFSLMRAYVAPDGTPAEYSPDNIPYRPRRVIAIDPQGVNEEDFVFILGYPGRTYRNRTSHHLAFEYQMRLPMRADLYEWQIEVLQGLGANDRSVALKLASRIKSLSNRMKNYRGKIQGIGRIKLIEQRRQSEQGLQEFIATSPAYREQYGNLLDEIAAVYSQQQQRYPYEFVLSYLRYSSILLRTASTVYQRSIELTKPDLERRKAYMERNLAQTEERLFERLENYVQPADEALLLDMIDRYGNLTVPRQIPALDDIFKTNSRPVRTARIARKMLKKSRLSDPEYVRQLLDVKPEDLAELKDPVMRLAVALYPNYERQRDIDDECSGKLDRLHNLLVEVKQAYEQTAFIPDANSTLRLTFGHIRGYSPADAIRYHPITTLDGVIEKRGDPPFDLPDEIVSLWRQKKFGRYEHPHLKSVPVGVLYNMDTTGGNSGSAVLNARGQLVGINFDRAYEATINDYAWNESYSRSIAVDIRYVLWVLEYYSQARNILAEIGL